MEGKCVTATGPVSYTHLVVYKRQVLLTGMLVAFLVSIVSIRFLMSFIKKHDFRIFGWYRIALAAVVAIYFGFIE